MRILFLNQYFPPDPAPTGVLFREIADEFARLGHEVDFVDAAQDYRAGQGKGGRMKRELGALWRMFREGCARPRADVVISGTSPPCLAVVADRIARKHRAAHVHWAMDVYPDLAVELGEVRRGSLVERFATSAMRRAYRRATAVVALDADMAVRLAAHDIEPETIRPWVPGGILASLPRKAAPEPPWTWIYSGNLGRAHEWETLLGAQALLESRGVGARLVFQGGGPAWPAAQARAAALGLRNVEWRGYVTEAELPASLLRCEVLAATQLPAVQGLLWPSKLALMSALPRPLLFIGPPQGAVAAWLRDLKTAATFAPGDAEGVARWLETHRAAPPAPREVSSKAHDERLEALTAWCDLLERVSPGH